MWGVRRRGRWGERGYGVETVGDEGGETGLALINERRKRKKMLVAYSCLYSIS